MLTLKWKDLVPVGRGIIITVAGLTLIVAAFAFATSYGAMLDFIARTGLYADGTGHLSRLERAWPLLFDFAFVVGQLAAILGQILRGSRFWPFVTMAICGGLTIWFQLVHAGADPGKRLAAAIPPVLMIVTCEIVVAIVKWVMRNLGRDLGSVEVVRADAVPTMLPTPMPVGMLPAAGPGGMPGGMLPAVQGQMYRTDLPPAGYGPGSGYSYPAVQGAHPGWDGSGQLPAPQTAGYEPAARDLPGNGQTGQAAVGRPDGTKSRAVEDVIDRHAAAGTLALTTVEQIAAEAGTSARTAGPIVKAAKEARGIPIGNGRRNGNGNSVAE